LQERDALYAKPHEALTDADGMRLGEARGHRRRRRWLHLRSRRRILLDGLGIESSLQERKMGELQGGQKVRVLLAQALFGNPSAMLLDEPTNTWTSTRALVAGLSPRIRGVLIVISTTPFP